MLLELLRTPIAQRLMQPLPVIEALNILKDRLSGLGPMGICFSKPVLPPSLFLYRMRVVRLVGTFVDRGKWFWKSMPTLVRHWRFSIR